jgi:hypothetical protein
MTAHGVSMPGRTDLPRFNQEGDPTTAMYFGKSFAKLDLR